MNKYSVDYTNLPIEVIDKINEAVDKLNYTLIMVCRLTNHPDDDRLFIVLAQHKATKSYCVWEANTFGNEASLFYGHYGISFKTALQIVESKVRDLNREENK